MQPADHSPTCTGTVKALNLEKGYGFILEDGSDREYFFHRSSTDDFDTLTHGLAVRFVPTAGTKGPRAEHVEVLT